MGHSDNRCLLQDWEFGAAFVRIVWDTFMQILADLCLVKRYRDYLGTTEQHHGLAGDPNPFLAGKYRTNNDQDAKSTIVVLGALSDSRAAFLFG